jgi:uncharacterized protein YeeX (DUF496 family)
MEYLKMELNEIRKGLAGLEKNVRDNLKGVIFDSLTNMISYIEEGSLQEAIQEVYDLSHKLKKAGLE